MAKQINVSLDDELFETVAELAEQRELAVMDYVRSTLRGDRHLIKDCEIVDPVVPKNPQSVISCLTGKV
jgi:hypothetical protein